MAGGYYGNSNTRKYKEVEINISCVINVLAAIRVK